MPANRDQDLKTIFVFNNLYEIYKRGQQMDRTGIQQGQVIKAGDVNSNMLGLVTVRKFQPASLLGKRIETARVAAAVAPSSSPVAPSSSGVPHITPPVIAPPVITKPAQLPLTDRAPAFAKTAHAVASNPVIEGLRKNLVDLQELHGRLRFMLTELEDLVREKK